MARFVRTWGLVVFWIIAIAAESTDRFSAIHTQGVLEAMLTWVFGAMSPDKLEHLNHILRKIGHFAGYAGLSHALYYAFSRSLERLAHWKHALSALLCTALIASADEFHQSFIPSRTASVHDVALDSLGAFAMQVCILAAILLTQRKALES